MKKITMSAVAVVAGVLLLTGFSMDNHPVKQTPTHVQIANDYASFTQYMQ